MSELWCITKLNLCWTVAGKGVKEVKHEVNEIVLFSGGKRLNVLA